jgi:tetratricopeptide (TPR) repeat protein
MGDPDAAEKEWRKTIELNPQNFQAYTLLGQLYLKQNKIPQAIKEIDKLIAQDEKLAPEDLQTAYLQKAYYLQLSKDIQGAVENYRKVLELDSQNLIALNNLAWLLADNDLDLEEALALAKEAKKKFPQSSEVADTLGWAYYKMKRYILAADQLLFSVNNRDQPTAENYYRLGMAYYKKDDPVQAKTTLRKALELDDKFDGAEEARRILNK